MTAFFGRAVPRLLPPPEPGHQATRRGAPPPFRTSPRKSLGGGLCPLRTSPENQVAPAKPALETADRVAWASSPGDPRGPSTAPAKPPPKHQDCAGKAGARTRHLPRCSPSPWPQTAQDVEKGPYARRRRRRQPARRTFCTLSRLADAARQRSRWALIGILRRASGAFRAAMKSPISETRAGELWWRSTRLTMAEPTMTPSATRPTRAACSGVAMPKPTQIGLVVMFRSTRRCCVRSGGSSLRTPVTPVSDTR